MIRKVIIVVLTLGAAGTLGLWADSLVPCGGRFSYIQLDLWKDRCDVYVKTTPGRVNVGYHVYPLGRDSCWSSAPDSVRWRSFFYTQFVETWCRDNSGLIRAGDHRQVTAPFWFPFLLLAAYPTLAFIRGPLRRYRRRKKGLCIKCGYNLTGNVSGVCPECGREIE